MDIHDLTAAFALDALDEHETREYEAHLAQCERCREELSRLSESAGALAWAVDAHGPPSAFREGILDAAAPARPMLPRSRPSPTRRHAGSRSREAAGSSPSIRPDRACSSSIACRRPPPGRRTRPG